MLSLGQELGNLSHYRAFCALFGAFCGFSGKKASFTGHFSALCFCSFKVCSIWAARLIWLISQPNGSHFNGIQPS